MTRPPRMRTAAFNFSPLFVVAVLTACAADTTPSSPHIPPDAGLADIGSDVASDASDAAGATDAANETDPGADGQTLDDAAPADDAHDAAPGDIASDGAAADAHDADDAPDAASGAHDAQHGEDSTSGDIGSSDADATGDSWDPVALGLPPWVHAHAPLALAPACGPGERALTHPFMAPSDIQLIYPLGWVSNQPGHIMPSDHQIVVQEDQLTARPVHAPASGEVYAFEVLLYDDDALEQAIDAFLAVRVCQGYGYALYHVSALSQPLSAWVHATVDAGDAECETLSPPEGPARRCRYHAPADALDLPWLEGGAQLGRLGGVTLDDAPVVGSAGMEIGVVDLLTPPLELTAMRTATEQRHVVCPLDAYADADLRDAYMALLDPESAGDCGTVALSVAGTAAGFWWSDLDAILDPFGVTDLALGLALVRAARRPGEQVMGVGDPAVGHGDFALFSPRPADDPGGRHNRPFDAILPGSGVHCFDALHVQVNVAAEDHALGHLFLEHVPSDAAGRSSVRVERVADGPCPATDAEIAAFAFGDAARVYWQPSLDDVVP